MKRAILVAGMLLVAGRADALEETWYSDKNAASHPIRNLPASTEATNPARRDDVSPASGGYLKGPGSHALPLTSVATIPGSDVSLTSTQIGFGSGSNTLTGSSSFWRDATNGTVVSGLTTNPFSSIATAHFARAIAADAEIIVTNSNSGTNASASLTVGAGSNDGTSGPVTTFGNAGPNTTLFGSNIPASSGYVWHQPGVGIGAPLIIYNANSVSGSDIVLMTGGSGGTPRVRVLNAGQVRFADLSSGGHVSAAAGTGQLSVSATIPYADITGGPVGLTDGDKGDITVSSSGATWTIDNDTISDAKFRNSGALSVIGRNVNSSGDPADISASAGSDAVLRENGSTIGFGTIATGGIANNAVTDAKIRQFAGLSVLGRGSNSTGNGADITAGSDGDVLRRSGTTLAFGAIPESSVTNLVSDLAAKEVALTFLTGLTRATNTITANLSTGVSGGQSVVGGTGASENLTLSSTTNGTKGKILFGGTSNYFDESTGSLSFGTASPNAASTMTVSKNQNGGTYLAFVNPSSGGLAYTAFNLAQSDNLLSGASFAMNLFSSGSTYGAPYGANTGVLQLSGGSGNLVIWNQQSTGDIVFYTKATFPNPPERMRIATGGGVTIADLAGTGTRMVTASAAGLLGTSSATGMLRGDSGVVSAATMPAADAVLISAGSTATPTGHNGFTYDGALDHVALSDDTKFSIYHVGQPGASNYERVTTYDNSGQITTQTEAGGTGNSDNVSLRTVAKQVDICNGSCASYFSVQPTGQLLAQGNEAITSADSAVADSIKLTPVATVSGSTAITANVFSGVTIPSFVIAGTANVTKAATLDVQIPSSTGGGAITTKYAIFSRSMIHVENGGGTVFEVPQDTTSNSTATQGRIPILVNGATKYLRYYND